jgi:hypothetical protein
MPARRQAPWNAVEIREPALVSLEFLGRLYGLPSGRLNTSS